MEYSIGEFSKLTGIGIHALRYYEMEHLIEPVRKANKRRCYTDADIKWVEFIKRLKDTGMPIKEIRKYSELRRIGDATLAARKEMLIQHRMKLLEEIEKMHDNLLKLDNKIEYYSGEIEKQ